MQTAQRFERLPQYRGAKIEQMKTQYRIDGRRYSRASTVMGVINKPNIPKWVKSETLAKVKDVLTDDQIEDGIYELLAQHPEEPSGETVEYYEEQQARRAAYRAWVDRLIEAAGKASDEKRDAAADRGHDIHAVVSRTVECMSMLALPSADMSDQLDVWITTVPQVRFALDFLADHGIKPVATEFTGWDESLGVAGTCDLVGYQDGELVILDWKTGSGPWPEMALQLGGYRALVRSVTGLEPVRGYVVKLTEDGYDLHPDPELTDMAGWLPAAEAAFMDAHRLWRTMKVQWFPKHR